MPAAAAAKSTTAVADPAEAIANFAMAARKALQTTVIDAQNLPISYRMGINTGPVYAGIIGSDRLFFDIWGDTVNVASRMESYGESGEITCPTHLRDELDNRFEFADRGKVEIKGKGEQHLWALIGPRN